MARHVYDKFKEVIKGGGRQFGKAAAATQSTSRSSSRTEAAIQVATEQWLEAYNNEISNPGFRVVGGGGGAASSHVWPAAEPAEWDEKNAARYRGAECGACGRDEMEEVYQEQDDGGYERVVKMVCSSCSHERLDVFRFHHYE